MQTFRQDCQVSDEIVVNALKIYIERVINKYSNAFIKYSLKSQITFWIRIVIANIIKETISVIRITVNSMKKAQNSKGMDTLYMINIIREELVEKELRKQKE